MRSYLAHPVTVSACGAQLASGAHCRSCGCSATCAWVYGAGTSGNICTDWSLCTSDKERYKSFLNFIAIHMFITVTKARPNDLGARGQSSNGRVKFPRAKCVIKQTESTCLKPRSTTLGVHPWPSANISEDIPKWISKSINLQALGSLPPQV